MLTTNGMGTLGHGMIGKQVKGKRYVHVAALGELDPDLRERVQRAATQTGFSVETEFNVIKIDEAGNQISLLHYENFFDSPFPALQSSFVVNLASGRIKRLRYDLSGNPPILHRKELLLPIDHPQAPLFAALTQQLEAAGLLRDTRRIGFAREWQARLQSAGYEVRDHQLITLNGAARSEQSSTEALARHRTALQRYALSTPMQALQRHGYLDGSWSIFDYGCGKGDDVRILGLNGIAANGWDPHYAPDAPHTPADIVNLGFVINVIEDPQERVHALHNAYALAGRLLAVAAMLTGREQLNGEQYGDGVRTRRNTFQKYYTQRELRDYLRSVLDKDPIAVGPGVFFVFKDEEEEQRFFAQRARNRVGLGRLISRLPKPTRAEREQTFYATHRELLDQLWETWLDLGRKPELTEVARRGELEEACGSLGKALRFLERFHGAEATTAAFRSRKEDLTVYFALQQFEQRKTAAAFSEELRRDLRTFFGGYQNAQTAARQLLFSTGNRELIRQLCREAVANGLGWLEKDRALYLHTSLVQRLPAVLRVYVGCASYLYGDVTSADLIKIHVDSAKLTLMSYDDFAGKPLPRLLERIKIRFRDQDVERFTYGDAYEPPYLYRKSRFLSEDFPYYAEQVAFEKALEALCLFDFENGVGPPAQIFDERLKAARMEIEGFTLRPARTLPHLDEPCGTHFVFRDFLQCGETQAKTGLPNIPEQVETYNALTRLATLVLDPVIDYFGEIVLTYGFCSRELAMHVPGRNAPTLDQHAGHELNTRGKPICPRLGAAVDFLVTDESMLDVAQWVVQQTPFDRLYFYGDDRPLHVSCGPDERHEVVIMTARASGRSLPKVVKTEAFLALARDALV
jgi:DNA phosphorothioation-associated putative methyltransferase